MLAARIGVGAVDDLRHTLAADWGEEIQDDEDMVAALGESRAKQPGGLAMQEQEQELVEQIRALVPMLEAHAAQAEQERKPWTR